MTISLTEWAKQNQAYILERLDEASMMRGFRELRPYQREALNALLDPNIITITTIPRRTRVEQTFVEVTTPIEPEVRIPNRASVEVKSPYFSNDCGKFKVVFNGVERKSDVCEYCISEGWIRVHAKTAKGKFKLERGQFVTIILRGKVEVSLKD